MRRSIRDRGGLTKLNAETMMDHGASRSACPGSGSLCGGASARAGSFMHLVAAIPVGDLLEGLIEQVQGGCGTCGTGQGLARPRRLTSWSANSTARA